MSQREHQRRQLVRAIVAVCDFEDSIAAEGERPHTACMAARTCLLLAAALAQVDTTSIIDLLPVAMIADRVRELISDATMEET